MVTSPPTSPPQKRSNNPQGGEVGAAGSGQLLQELEALSQALYQAQKKSISSQTYPSQPLPYPQPPSQPQAPSGKKLSFLSRREVLSGRRPSHDTSKDVSSKEPVHLSSVPAHNPPPSFANLLSRHSLSSVQASTSLEQQKPSPANMHPRYSSSLVSSQNSSAWGDEKTDIRSRMHRRLSLQPLPAKNLVNTTPEESVNWPEDPLESSRRYDSISADKKKSVWSSWKPLRALSHIGRQRLHCVFSAYVHAIEGLPPAMNGLRLCVHMRKEETKEGAVQTMPSRVFQGMAEFQETLFMKCTLYGSKGPSSSPKFMAKAFIVSVIAPDIDELDFGKHQLDLSRLLGDFMDDNEGQLEKGNSWDTSLDLTGKAKGGRLAITFNYEILDKDSAFTGNVSSRFRESPPHRSSMHSSYSLPNSAHGTPRTITTRAHLSHSPSASEPGNDYDDLLAMDQLNLDEPNPISSGYFEARDGQAGGQIGEVRITPAFYSQPTPSPTASQCSSNASPSMNQNLMSLLQTNTSPAPLMPSQSMVVESAPRLPQFMEEDGPLSEDEADFVVVDQGMEIDDFAEKHSDVIREKEMNNVEESSDDLVTQVVEMDAMDDLPHVIDVEGLADLSPKTEMDAPDDLLPHVIEMESLDDPTRQVDEMKALDDADPQHGLDDVIPQLLEYSEPQGHEYDDERLVRQVFDGEQQQAEAFGADESTVDDQEVQKDVQKLVKVDEGERRDNVTYLKVMQTLDSLLQGTRAKELPQEEEKVEVKSSVEGTSSDEEDTAQKDALDIFSPSSLETEPEKSVIGLNDDCHDTFNNLEDDSNYEDAEEDECGSKDDDETVMSNIDVESCNIFVEKEGGILFSEEGGEGSTEFEEEAGARVVEEDESDSKNFDKDEADVQVLEQEERVSKNSEEDKTDAHVLEEEETVACGFEDDKRDENDFEEVERGIAIFEEEGVDSNALKEEEIDKNDFEEEERGIAKSEEEAIDNNALKEEERDKIDFIEEEKGGIAILEVEGVGNRALEEEKTGSHVFDKEEEDNLTVEEQERNFSGSPKHVKGDFHTDEEGRGMEVTDEERGSNIVTDKERGGIISAPEEKGSCAVSEDKRDSNIVFVKEETENKNLGSKLNFCDDSVFNYVQEGEKGNKGPDIDMDILQERTYGEADRNSDEDIDREVDLVAGEFLDMLGMANPPETKGYDSEMDSPRARLLKQFEEEAFLEGGFGLDLEVPEFSLDGCFDDEEAGGPASVPFCKSASQGLDKEPSNRDHTSVLMSRDIEPTEWHQTSLFTTIDKESAKWGKKSTSQGIEEERAKWKKSLASEETGKESANLDHNLAFKRMEKEPALWDHTPILEGHEKEPAKWNYFTDLKAMEKGPAKWEHSIDLKGTDKEPADLDQILALKKMGRDPGKWEPTSAFKGIGFKKMGTEPANWESTLALKKMDEELVRRDHTLHLRGMEKEPVMDPPGRECTLALNEMHEEPANWDGAFILDRRDTGISHWGTEKADKEPIFSSPGLPPKAAEKETVNLDFEDDEDLLSFMEAAESELHRANQSRQSKTRAKMLEDAETEALMQEWGLNEKAFVTSPPKPTKRQQEPPPLGKGLDATVPLKDGGSLRSMNPSHFQAHKSNGKLVIQISKPVVVPAEMGSETADILRNMASMGVENMALQAMTAMPLEDITGRSVEQVASEGKMASKSGHCLLEGSTGSRKELSHNDSRKSRPSVNIADDMVSLEDIAPMAMQQIEALAMDGLKVQSDVGEDEAAFTLNAFSVDGEPGGMDSSTGSAIVKGITGVHLSKGGRYSSSEISIDGGNGPMGMAISLDEWMLLDAGLYDEMETTKDSMAIMAAHHAAHQELVVAGVGDDDKRKKKQGPTGARWGCMGNTLTIAMLVQLRDPLKNNEAVGAPMMAFVQAERMMKPPKMKVGRNVSVKGNSEDEEAASGSEEPQFQITGVHMAGLKNSQEEKKAGWGNQKQLQSGSRWLIANGMSKNAKGQARSMLSSKPSVTSPSSSAKVNNASKGESLWSLSARVLSGGLRWKTR